MTYGSSLSAPISSLRSTSSSSSVLLQFEYFVYLASFKISTHFLTSFIVSSVVFLTFSSETTSFSGFLVSLQYCSFIDSISLAFIASYLRFVKNHATADPTPAPTTKNINDLALIVILLINGHYRVGKPSEDSRYAYEYAANDMSFSSCIQNRVKRIYMIFKSVHTIFSFLLLTEPPLLQGKYLP